MLGRLANWQGEMDRVEAVVKEGLRLSAGAEVEVRVAASLREAMGDVALVREDYERAEEVVRGGPCALSGSRRDAVKHLDFGVA